LRELQLQPAPAHRVGTVDHAFLLDAQDLGERCGVRNRHEGAFRHRRRSGKARIVSRQVDVPDPGIRGGDLGDARLRQLLDQAVLQGAKLALRAASRLRRIGRNVFDAEPIERTAHLREPLPVDRLTGLGGVEVMAAAIRVEARRQAVRREHFKQRPKRRGGTFLLDQKRRVDRARRIVHGDD
jgi:hypothetical protein